MSSEIKNFTLQEYMEALHKLEVNIKYLKLVCAGDNVVNVIIPADAFMELAEEYYAEYTGARGLFYTQEEYDKL